MSLYVDSLKEMRDLIAAQIADVMNDALREKRALTVEDRTKIDGLNEAAADAEKRYQAAVEVEQREADIKASIVEGRTNGAKPEDTPFGKFVREARSGEGFTLPFDMQSIRSEQRAMSATGGVGRGSVSSLLWEFAVEASEILNYARVITTADGNTIPMPRVTSHAEPGAADIAANGVVPAGNSVIDTVDLSVTKRGFITAVPNELLQDATFDVEGYIARNAGRALGLNVAAAAVAAARAGFTTVGVTTPAGVLNNLGNQSTAGQGTDLLIDLFHSVLAPYRSSSSAAFGMSDLAAAIVRKLKTSSGEPVWQPALIAGSPDAVLGKPVFIAPGFDTFGASRRPIFFGDWDALVVRIAGGLRFERSADAGFENDQTQFRSLVRRGAVALDANAVKPLATPAA